MRSESLESIQDLKSKLELQSSAGELIGNAHIGAQAAGAAFINVGLPTNSCLGADAFGRLLHTLSDCDSAGGADMPWALGYGGSSAGHSSLLLLVVGDSFYPAPLKHCLPVRAGAVGSLLSVLSAAGRRTAGTRGPHSCLRHRMVSPGTLEAVRSLP